MSFDKYITKKNIRGMVEQLIFFGHIPKNEFIMRKDHYDMLVERLSELSYKDWNPENEFKYPGTDVTIKHA